MTDSPGDGSDGSDETGGEGDVAWPVALRGVTESVVTTRGPSGRWNVAALGLHAGDPVTARTYGRTRTRRNFREEGGGYVQFTRDPVDFVDAALTVREENDPLLDSADAWARVSVTERDLTVEGGAAPDGIADPEDGTEVVTWGLSVVESGVERETVPTTNRGFNAVVEATVAASRLDVDAYDTERLRERLEYFASVVESCGGEHERRAFERLETVVDWRD